MKDDLLKIFDSLKKELKKYEDPFRPKCNTKNKYGLWSFKDLEIAGRKRKKYTLPG